MIREDICLAMLRVLKRCSEFKLPRESLFERVRTHMGESVTHDVLLENLKFCSDNGWIASDLNAFKSPRHWLTQSGEIQLSGGP